MKNNFFKKIILISIIFILLSTTLVTGIQNQTNKYINTTNRNHKIINNKIKNNHGYEQFLVKSYKTMELPISLDNKENKKINIEPIETPDVYSWTDIDSEDWTTYAKNQGNCGSCWLFSAMGAFESVINIRENCYNLNPDLSEQYVLSCLPEAGSCHGGNIENCVFYYIMNTSDPGYNCNGVIPEEIFNYQSTFENIPPCSDKPPEWADYLIPILDYNESWPDLDDPTLIDAMKTLIYQKGPIMIYFWASDRFIRWGGYHKDPLEYYPDYNENTPYYVNHGITIVGWKDDPNIGNGGYWICKNTWGPNWGYKGFVNIEYNILNLGGFIAWVDYDPETYDWPPVANSGGFYQGSVGEEIIFDAEKSVDPEGEIISYIWDFGDNLTDNGQTITHIYDEPGVYPVTLTVVDNVGQENSKVTLVGVDQEPLSVEISGGIGITINFDNPVDLELKNWEYDIEIEGIVIPNKISGIYRSIPANGEIETDISVFGIGFGKIHVMIEDFSKTQNLFIFGPFVKIFNR